MYKKTKICSFFKFDGKNNIKNYIQFCTTTFIFLQAIRLDTSAQFYQVAFCVYKF